jgi:transposase
MYDTYVKSGCIRTVRRRFARKFQVVTIPHRKTIHAIVNKVRQTGSLLNKKRAVSKRRVLTEEKLDEIGARLERSPRKSFRLIAQETGISKTSARTAAMLLKLKPNETTVHELQPRDPATRGIHVGKQGAFSPPAAVWVSFMCNVYRLFVSWFVSSPILYWRTDRRNVSHGSFRSPKVIVLS